MMVSYIGGLHATRIDCNVGSLTMICQYTQMNILTTQKDLTQLTLDSTGSLDLNFHIASFPLSIIKSGPTVTQTDFPWFPGQIGYMSKFFHLKAFLCFLKRVFITNLMQILKSIAQFPFLCTFGATWGHSQSRGMKRYLSTLDGKWRCQTNLWWKCRHFKWLAPSWSQ